MSPVQIPDRPINRRLRADACRRIVAPMIMVGLLLFFLATPTIAFGQEADPTSYTVRPGDTLAGIAQVAYGSSAEWPRIYEANRGQILNPDRIFPGQTLVVAPISRHPFELGAEAGALTHDRADVAVHVVRPGETLATIAQVAYGSSAEWPRIYEANRGQIVNPHRIYLGQSLLVPAPADSAAMPASDAAEIAPSPQAGVAPDGDQPAPGPGSAPAPVLPIEDASGIAIDPPSAESHPTPVVAVPPADRADVLDDSGAAAEQVPVASGNRPLVEVGAGSKAGQHEAEAGQAEVVPTPSTVTDASSTAGHSGREAEAAAGVLTTGRPVEPAPDLEPIGTSNNGHGAPAGNPTGAGTDIPATMRTTSGASPPLPWPNASMPGSTGNGGYGVSLAPGRAGSRGVGVTGPRPEDDAGRGTGSTTTGGGGMATGSGTRVRRRRATMERQPDSRSTP